MIARPSKVAAILLASGLSRRFGAPNKLLQDLGGKPLFTHALEALAQVEPADFVVVCQPELAIAISQVDPDARLILNHQPEAGLGRSIALGASAIQASGAEAMLVALADMPFVTPGMLRALIEALSEGVDACACAETDGRVTPPAIFARSCFDRLAALDGDTGARSVLLDPGLRVSRLTFPEECLADIDTPADLKLARQILQDVAGLEFRAGAAAED